MIKHYIEDVARNEKREADTGFLSLRQWVQINFGMWGFYQIVKDGKQYKIFDKMDNNRLCYIIY